MNLVVSTFFTIGIIVTGIGYVVSVFSIIDLFYEVESHKKSIKKLEDEIILYKYSRGDCSK